MAPFIASTFEACALIFWCTVGPSSNRVIFSAQPVIRVAPAAASTGQWLSAPSGAERAGIGRAYTVCIPAASERSSHLVVVLPTVSNPPGYRPVHFVISDFMPPEMVALYGEQCWGLLSDTLLWTADALQEYFAPARIIINDWHLGGRLRYRGFRPADCPVGAPFSMHKLGRAIDFNVVGMSSELVRRKILAQQRHDGFQFVARIERSPLRQLSWVHIDVASSRTGDIVLFAPLPQKHCAIRIAKAARPGVTISRIVRIEPVKAPDATPIGAAGVARPTLVSMTSGESPVLVVQMPAAHEPDSAAAIFRM